jgi:hypothetical protein
MLAAGQDVGVGTESFLAWELESASPQTNPY